MELIQIGDFSSTMNRNRLSVQNEWRLVRSDCCCYPR